MTDTKCSTDKSNSSPTKPKLVIGSIGYYKGVWAEVKTTRCFFKTKDNLQLRGVELYMEIELDHARREFLNAYRLYGPEGKTTVFVDIVDFRKNFVYSETASLIYAK